MHEFDMQRKNTLIESLLKAKADAERFLRMVVEDEKNAGEVEEVRTALRHITWALNDLTKEVETK